jgi:superfamily I DNA/RNA helicase
MGYTLHAFSNQLLHRIPIAGLERSFIYYSRLFALIAEDLSILVGRQVSESILKERYERLDSRDGLIEAALEIGTYYNAVTHWDCVYRTYQHLTRRPEDVPRYRVLIVDEFQDFNHLEVEFIRVLADSNPVLIAGDDDQALYESKNASPDFIRDLAASPQYELFDLPYCSRCTKVLVEAVHRVIKEAQQRSLLENRIEKPFECYLPDKWEDSCIYPTIPDVYCTVDNRRAPYIGRFIAKQIEMIPQEDFTEARSKGEPTVLVMGPRHFVESAYRELRDQGINVSLRRSDNPPLDIVDGYRMIAKDGTSRLGWRIVVHVKKPSGWQESIRQALIKDKDICDFLPRDFVQKHLEVARLLTRLAQGYEPDEELVRLLEEETGMSVQEVRNRLLLATPNESEPSDESLALPDVLCTTLVGAKGLACQHAFIVGMNNRHFPRNPSDITEREVCQLIVGLTRARKQCSLVSCGRFGSERLSRSVFLSWLSPFLEPVLRVDKECFRQ